MNIKKVKLICFSATGNTEKVLESIAKGICFQCVEHINMALAKNTAKPLRVLPGELAVVGAPVYGGRLPEEAVRRLRQLRAGRTLAVPVVVYGNRAFEDALLELKNLVVELGLIPVAGGAFIGEHSFATKDFPIAAGRPDHLDIQTAMDFGKRIKEKIAALRSLDDLEDLNLPGSYPYQAKGARAMAVSPVTIDKLCTACGTCAGVCPLAAVSINGRVETNADLCIRCCACIKNCRAGARVFQDSMMETITTWLNENCHARKDPELFYTGP